MSDNEDDIHDMDYSDNEVEDHDHEELFTELFGFEDDPVYILEKEPKKKKSHTDPKRTIVSNQLQTLTQKAPGIIEPSDPENFRNIINSTLGTTASTWEEAETEARKYISKRISKDVFKGKKKKSTKTKIPLKRPAPLKKKKQQKKLTNEIVLRKLEQTYKASKGNLNRMHIYKGPPVHALEKWNITKYDEIMKTPSENLSELYDELKQMPDIGIGGRVAPPKRKLTKRERVLVELNTIFLHKDEETPRPKNKEIFIETINEITKQSAETWTQAEKNARLYLQRKKPKLIDAQKIVKTDPLEKYTIIRINSTFIKLRQKPTTTMKSKPKPKTKPKTKIKTTTTAIKSKTNAGDKTILIGLKETALNAVNSFEGTSNAFISLFDDELDKINGRAFKEAGIKLLKVIYAKNKAVVEEKSVKSLGELKEGVIVKDGVVVEDVDDMGII